MQNNSESIKKKFQSLSKEAIHSIDEYSKFKKISDRIINSKKRNFNDWFDKKTANKINQIMVLIAGIGAYLTFTSKGWIYAIIAFFVIFFISAFVFESYLKSQIPKKCKYYGDKSDKLLINIEQLFHKHIFPELLSLGQFSIDTIFKNTDATYLSPIIIETFLNQKYKDDFKKIEIAENVFLYQCTLPEAFDNIDTEYIENFNP